MKNLGLENIGCDELAGNRNGFRFFYNPKTKLLRLWGKSKPEGAFELRDLVAFIISRSKI